VEVFEVKGPFFFGAAYKFKESLHLIEKNPRVLIIRMRHVPVIDSTGLHILEEVFHQAKNGGTVLIISGIQKDVFKEFDKSGLLDKIGKKNVFTLIDEALLRARALVNENHPSPPNN